MDVATPPPSVPNTCSFVMAQPPYANNTTEVKPMRPTGKFIR